jgi:hypothetical protein
MQQQEATFDVNYRYSLLSYEIELLKDIIANDLSENDSETPKLFIKVCYSNLVDELKIKENEKLKMENDFSNLKEISRDQISRAFLVNMSVKYCVKSLCFGKTKIYNETNLILASTNGLDILQGLQTNVKDSGTILKQYQCKTIGCGLCTDTKKGAYYQNEEGRWVHVCPFCFKKFYYERVQGTQKSVDFKDRLECGEKIYQKWFKQHGLNCDVRNKYKTAAGAGGAGGGGEKKVESEKITLVEKETKLKKQKVNE